MKRLPALLVLSLITLVLVSGNTAAEAAKKRAFRQATVCGWSNSYVEDKTTSGLHIEVRAGRWKQEDGSLSAACYSEFNTVWRPTVRSFTATVRWYAGSTLLKKTKRTVVNNQRDRGFDLGGAGLYSAKPYDGGLWTKNGKRIWATVTLSKKGYKTKVIKRTSFYGYS